MTRLRTKPRREVLFPGKQSYYRQGMQCRKCKQWKGLAGCSRKGGFTCRECVQGVACA